MYVEQCGFYDNGRVKTWLPYRRNKDSTALVHDISQEKLLGDQLDKFYTFWYGGPKVYPPSYISFMLFIMHVSFNG